MGDKPLQVAEYAIKELIASVAPALKPELSITRAVGLYVALTLPEIYRELVTDRGWKSSQLRKLAD